MSLSAIEAMNQELKRIQEAQSHCLNDAGYVMSEHKYRYQILTEKAKAFRESIEWMQQQKAGVS